MSSRPAALKKMPLIASGALISHIAICVRISSPMQEILVMSFFEENVSRLEDSERKSHYLEVHSLQKQVNSNRYLLKCFSFDRTK